MKKYSLPAKILTPWIEALRSGKYKQGQSNLYNSECDTYCCLGVAAAICNVSKESMDYQDFVLVPDVNGWELDAKAKSLTVTALENGYPLALLWERCANSDSSLSNILSNMNDSGNDSFEDIAIWLEENVEGADE